jgi:hypothetical protein
VSALLRLGLREPAREREILIALGGSRERPPGIYPFQARCCCLLMFLIVISAFGCRGGLRAGDEVTSYSPSANLCNSVSMRMTNTESASSMAFVV